ncbi:hypothetical protein ACHAQH_000968 [Verticillium albo-atrum]
MAEVATTPIKEEFDSSPAKSTTDPISQKRKASPTDADKDDAAKRPKIESPEHNYNGARRMSHTSATSRPDSRDSHRDAPDNRGRRGVPVSKDEEKKRGKRLFGGLLGTLNQPGSGAQLKRRREIEQRQQERVQKQKVEAEKRSAERLSRVTQVRKAEQINFDEKVMKTRHANMLARAHSLETRVEPRLYYQPWKFTRAQEDIIDDQIADAKATMAREVEEFALRRDQHDRAHGRTPAPVPSAVPADEFEPARAAIPAAIPADTTNDKPQSDAKNAHDHDAQQQDEPGDVVVEAEEDTVMY